MTLAYEAYSYLCLESDVIGSTVGSWNTLTVPYSVAEESDQRLGAPNRVTVVVFATLNCG